MFKSANNYTFEARAREVLATVSLMWFAMLVVICFFKVVGLASVDFSHDMPILGVSANYLLQSNELTVNQALTSPFVVMGILITVIGAPLAEEILFRWFICRSCASDVRGNLRPGGVGLGIVLVGSFILFGIAHGQGYFSLMIQGVGGLLLARLFFRNGPDLKSAYFSCVAAHGLYNTSIVLVSWIWLS